MLKAAAESAAAVLTHGMRKGQDFKETLVFSCPGQLNK